MPNPIKVAIADDNGVYRKIVISYLLQQKDLNIIIEAGDGKELIHALERELPDVVLLDLEMPVLNGKKTTDYLSKYYPKIKIIILTIHNNEKTSLELIKKGVNGFLLKENGIYQITEAISAVMKYGYYFAGWDLKKIVSVKNNIPNQLDAKGAKFKERELTIVKMLCQGLTSKEISDKTFISIRTVEGYRSKIFKKAAVNNVAGLAVYALKYGLITFTADDKQ